MTMARGDLVTLGALKAHLGVQSSADDILLSSMISQISRAICTWLNRAFIWPRDVADMFDGNGLCIDFGHWRSFLVVGVYCVRCNHIKQVLDCSLTCFRMT
ncbi:hypothetical protein M2322_003205 [Rhodoblastus acidophilus]|uniref:head-tail connector protein n=1 Tax=Rhodoblastus acidophilus TaxID=1074 RepID=UPI0022241EB8|nr:head-tail connector protein [Rhodoblastus acidophilus]MCW2317641.1 hypothetical protein [Rhodoblastus acidophilus]